MAGVHAPHFNISASGGGSAGNGRGHNTIRDDAVAHSLLRFEGADADGAAASAGDIEAHGPQVFLQGNDLRLPGGAADDGVPFRPDGGQHDVLRGSHAGEGQGDISPMKLLGLTVDLPAGFINLRPQLAQGGQVQVNGPLAQLAAAGQAESGAAAAGDQCPHEDDGGAHLHHQGMGYGAAAKAGGIYVNIAAPLLGGAAQVAQDAQGRVHIPELGHVQQLRPGRADDGGGDNRQGRILRALHKTGPFQPVSTSQVPYVHEKPPVHSNQAILCTEGISCY